MGTRSITHTHKDGHILCSFYKHWDGYPSEYGRDLKRVLMKMNETTDIGDMAAQVIAAIKQGPKDVYMIAAGQNDMGEEFTYDIYRKDDAWWITCTHVSKGVLYDGPVAEFDTSVE